MSTGSQLRTLDLGVYSFGNTPRTAESGDRTAQAIRNVLEAVHVAGLRADGYRRGDRTRTR